VADEKAVDAAQVLSRSGGLHIVFNNAGVCVHKGTLEAGVAEWRQVIDINLTGEYIMIRAAARIMIERSIRGSIINSYKISHFSGLVNRNPQEKKLFLLLGLSGTYFIISPF
jgi:NAD(P)-dependent dehydrogenase (short-subunit alcohol dehydrogenase family)